MNTSCCPPTTSATTLSTLSSASARSPTVTTCSSTPDRRRRLARRHRQARRPPGRRVPRVEVLHRPGKEGLGQAYLAGFRHALAAGADLLFEMDADLSHDASYLPHFVALIDQGADLVLGSRYVRGGGVENWPLSRKVISRGGCLYAQAVLGLPYHDLTGGFKCFRRRVLETIDLDAIDTRATAFRSR